MWHFSSVSLLMPPFGQHFPHSQLHYIGRKCFLIELLAYAAHNVLLAISRNVHPARILVPGVVDKKAYPV